VSSLSVAVSSLSVAVSSLSVATSKVSLRSTVHSRERLVDREIARRQLQEAVKHAGHKRIPQDRYGQSRWRIEHAESSTSPTRP